MAESKAKPAIKPVDCLCEDGDEWGPSVMECILETPAGSLLVCAQDDRAVYILALPGCSLKLKKRVQSLMDPDSEDGLSFTDDTNARSFAKKLAAKTG